MMKRGENLLINMRRQHDGSIWGHKATSHGALANQTMPVVEKLEFGSPDEAADYLIQLAESLRNRERQKTG